VPPEGKSWSFDLVVDSLLETLEAAKLRAVDPDILIAHGHQMPAIFPAGSLAAGVQPVGGVMADIFWDRLEPHTRSENLEEGLQERIADPLWLLARQWQVGEFRGEDAASPIHARVRVASTPIESFRNDAVKPSRSEPPAELPARGPGRGGGGYDRIGGARPRRRIGTVAAAPQSCW
jgi:hypothetical protein